MSNNNENITVLVVDDHPMMRRGVMQLLAMDKVIRPVGEADSGEEAIKRRWNWSRILFCWISIWKV